MQKPSAYYSAALFALFGAVLYVGSHVKLDGEEAVPRPKEGKDFNPLVGHHGCTFDFEEDWRITFGVDELVDLSPLWNYIRKHDPIMVDHDKIAWKGMQMIDMIREMVQLFRESRNGGENHPFERRARRYIDAEIRYPGIVVRGAPNPRGLPYRLVDGAHRMAKMKMSTNISKSAFHVIPLELFLGLLRYPFENEISSISGPGPDDPTSRRHIIRDFTSSTSLSHHFVAANKRWEVSFIYVYNSVESGQPFAAFSQFAAAAKHMNTTNSEDDTQVFGLTYAKTFRDVAEMLFSEFDVKNIFDQCGGECVLAVHRWSSVLRRNKQFSKKTSSQEKLQDSIRVLSLVEKTRECDACHSSGSAYCGNLQSGEGRCLNDGHDNCNHDTGEEMFAPPSSEKSKGGERADTSRAIRFGCPVRGASVQRHVAFVRKNRFPLVFPILRNRNFAKRLQERDATFTYVAYCFWSSSIPDAYHLWSVVESASGTMEDTAFTYFDTDIAKPQLLDHFEVSMHVPTVQVRQGKGRPWRSISGPALTVRSIISTKQKLANQNEPHVHEEAEK
eukprot:g3455.t1